MRCLYSLSVRRQTCVLYPQNCFAQMCFRLICIVHVSLESGTALEEIYREVSAQLGYNTVLMELHFLVSVDMALVRCLTNWRYVSKCVLNIKYKKCHLRGDRRQTGPA